MTDEALSIAQTPTSSPGISLWHTHSYAETALTQVHTHTQTHTQTDTQTSVHFAQDTLKYRIRTSAA